MKVTQTWTRNTPSSAGEYSITVNITYSGFSLSEINEVEKRLPKGMLVMDTDKQELKFINEKPTSEQCKEIIWRKAATLE